MLSGVACESIFSAPERLNCSTWWYSACIDAMAHHTSPARRKGRGTLRFRSRRHCRQPHFRRRIRHRHHCCASQIRRRHLCQQNLWKPVVMSCSRGLFFECCICRYSLSARSLETHIRIFPDGIGEPSTLPSARMADCAIERATPRFVGSATLCLKVGRETFPNVPELLPILMDERSY